MMVAPDFWNDSEKAQKIIDQNNSLKKIADDMSQISMLIDDIEVALEMIQMESDQELKAEAEDNLEQLIQLMDHFEIMLLLNGDYDDHNAILELHPGAGGTESQDFGEMLLRMYTRWMDQRGFKHEIIDYQSGDEAGIKSVTIRVEGPFAYGLLKAERGVHRLVRISPFDSGGRRHTSFCSCEVSPEITDEVNIDINPDDLRIDTYRSSGAGGQHVNVTDSAVRITHLPTGIVVSSQAGRSQLANRQTAMDLLKSKLYQKEIEEKEAEMAALRGQQKEIGWGSQIRSYVFHPYQMVKDHRTNAETSNTGAVMDGDLDPFIEAYLRFDYDQDAISE